MGSFFVLKTKKIGEKMLKMILVMLLFVPAITTADTIKMSWEDYTKWDPGNIEINDILVSNGNVTVNYGGSGSSPPYDNELPTNGQNGSTQVPEPGTAWLMALSLLGLLYFTRRKRNRVS